MDSDLNLFCEEEQESEEDLSDVDQVEEEEEEQSDESNDEEEDVKSTSSPPNEGFLFGKNKTSKWYQQPQAIGQKKSFSKNQRSEGAVHPNFPIHSTKAAFQMFLTEEMVEIIIECTNKKGAFKYGQRWEPVNKTELYAWIGLHIRAGINHDGLRPIHELFSAKEGPAVYGASMSRRRFNEIKENIRFDDIETRQERKESSDQGSLSPIHDIFTKFVESCNAMYKPYKNVTIDESIVGFKGRCSFKIYMPSKPVRFGLKVWTMCDSKNSILCNAQVYTGKKFKGSEIGQGKRVVLDLSTNIAGTGRNITADNLFTSISLCEELWNRNLTFLGTMRKNKGEIPPSFQGSKRREVQSTNFGFSKDLKMMMASYVPKKGKSVVMLSSAHYCPSIDEQPPFKPKMILDYNKSKGGVDTFDQCIKNYSCKRTTNRWPLSLIYWIIDASEYNSSVCYMMKNPAMYQGSQKRRKFLYDLSEELLGPQILRRAQSTDFSRLHKETRTKINLCLPSEPMVPQAGEGTSKKRRCIKCPRQMDKKTTKSCAKCSMPICNDHIQYICNDCLS